MPGKAVSPAKGRCGCTRRFGRSGGIQVGKAPHRQEAGDFDAGPTFRSSVVREPAFNHGDETKRVANYFPFFWVIRVISDRSASVNTPIFLSIAKAASRCSFAWARSSSLAQARPS